MRPHHFLTVCLSFGILFNAQSQEKSSGSTDSVAIKELLKQGRELSATDAKTADSIALIVFESTPSPKWKGQAALIIVMANRLSDTNRAFAWTDSTLRYGVIAKDYGTAAVGARIRANGATQRFKHDEALRLLLLSKQYLEITKDTNNLILTHLSLSLLYHNEIKDYQLGKKYALDALVLAEKSGIKKTMWWINNNIAINYDDNNEPEMALKYHFENIRTNADSALSSETYNNIANTYLKTGRTKEALRYLKKAYGLYKRYSRPVEVNYDFATVHNNLSCAYAFLGDRALMETHRDSAMYFAHQSKNIEKLYDCYRDAYQNEERFGNYKKASAYLNQYLTLKDSVYNSEKVHAITDFEVQYETQKKEGEIKMLQASSQIKDLQVKQARNSIVLVVALVALAALLIFLVIRRNAQRDKIKRLQEKEDDQRKQFAAVLEGEERERARIARELHDGVGQLLSITKLSLTGVRDERNGNDVLLNNAIASLDDATKEVRSVSHNLMPAALSTVGLEAALRDLTEKINRSGQVHVTLELSGLDQSIGKTTEIHIYRMLQEITNNILKHAGAQKINIRVLKEIDRFEIVVSDNGRRLDTSAIENGKGLGWKNIMSRIAVMNGSVEVDSTDQTGTTLQIKLSA